MIDAIIVAMPLIDEIIVFVSFEKKSPFFVTLIF